MSEPWAIALATIGSLAMCGLLGWVVYTMMHHIHGCAEARKLDAAALSRIEESIKSIQGEIGTRDTGMRGDIHGHTDELTIQAGDLWMIAEKLGVKLSPRTPRNRHLRSRHDAS